MPPRKRREKAASDAEDEAASGTEEDDDDVRPQRITVSRAKSEFKLSDADLALLTPPRLAPNPHYRSAAPMKLYDLKEVNTAAEAKAAAKEAADRAKSELMRLKKAAERERAAQVTAAANEAVGVFASTSAKQQSARMVGGGMPLPTEVLSDVLCIFAQQGGLDEVRDELVAARDVATAARACRDMHLAAQPALVALGGMLAARLEACKDTCAPFDDEMAVVADVQALVTAPAALSVPRLKAVCRALSLHVGGTKPVLILRALEELRVPAPSADRAPPAVLLLEAWRQRRERPLQAGGDERCRRHPV
ncbi:hypothetical protein FOA52_013987 [Chlamydomonas sp. UWO 241]|nr:hypothetical protein FOA52_013987 [Chlamydomonas sp. UWO 241]